MPSGILRIPWRHGPSIIVDLKIQKDMSSVNCPPKFVPPIVRTDFEGVTHRCFMAAGVKPPPQISKM